MELSGLAAGTHTYIRLPTGAIKRIVKLNNAATTPPFFEVLAASGAFMQSYDAVHRGSGIHAQQLVERLDWDVGTIAEFTGGKEKGFLFTANTSEAILKLARLFRFSRQDVVLVSDVEHTSNYLPWKYASNAQVRTFPSDMTGAFSEDTVKEALENTENVKLVAVTGASNLSGFIPPIGKIAKIVHEYGAQLFVDAAQLAPHRPLELEKNGIDFAAFSAHKMYAPFGLGVLVAPVSWLEERTPIDPAGGSPDYVSEEKIVWTQGIKRHQPGTWNAHGIATLAQSMRVLARIGWKKIRAHEGSLARHLQGRLAASEDVRRYGIVGKNAKDATPLFTFNVRNRHYALVSSFLANEHAISTRSGEICNHRLVARWHGLGTDEVARIARKVELGDLLAKPGVVRASFGIFNTIEDADALADALEKLCKNGPRLRYVPKSLPEPEFCVA